MGIEKSTITISTAAAVFCSILGIGGGILGNYYATRSAVQLELNQLMNDIRIETIERRGEDNLIRMSIIQLQAALKPEEPNLKRKR